MRSRVAIAFDSSTVGCSQLDGTGCTGDALDGDLDLEITDESGNQVCYSGSYDSSYELCDFPVVNGKTYHARIVKWTTSATATYLGIAWQTYSAFNN